jgi:hypothetical protein
MPEANNWNDKTITEFRANGGRVGGNFEGAPVALVHHRGSKSGRESRRADTRASPTTRSALPASERSRCWS